MTTERAEALLGRHYVEGRLDALELERRLDLIHAGEDALSDLPPLQAPEKRSRWGRRHGESRQTDPSWVPTKERFIDPTTQRVMRVWVDPGDHSRHYVAEP